jgi:hypothetical protein
MFSLVVLLLSTAKSAVPALSPLSRTVVRIRMAPLAPSSHQTIPVPMATALPVYGILMPRQAQPLI